MANATETARRLYSYAALISRYKRQLDAIEANIATLVAHGDGTWVLKAAQEEKKRLLDKIDKTKTVVEVLQDSLESE